MRLFWIRLGEFGMIEITAINFFPQNWFLGGDMICW